MRPGFAVPTVSRMTGMEARDADLEKELDATLRARRELGEEYEPALVDSFLEKVGTRIDAAVEQQVRRQLAERQTWQARESRSARESDSWGERFGFALVSLVLAVPLSAIGGLAGLPGLAATWAGIVGVNVVQAARFNPDLFAGHRRRAERSADR